MLKLRRTASRLDAVAALATALCVFAAPLASIEHETLVRHIACLEHGELVDAPQLTAAQLAAPEHHHARTVAERSDATPNGADLDEHCLLATWSSQRSTPSHEKTSIAAPQPVRALPIAAATDRLAPAIAIYRLAPKLSPPLASL